MNLQKLRFAVEIEKTSSITQAAKNLYMSQPNLSKSIKELESEIGMTIFRRTTKGVEPTAEGLEFLSHAKSILKQMDIMNQIYCSPKENTFNFKICVPRTTYLTTAFSDFMQGMKKNTLPINIHYRETAAEETINNIALGNFDIGIIRFQEIYQSYFLNRLKESNLDYDLLWSFKMRIIMGKNHPLAGYETVPYELLGDYIEILHGDLQIPNIRSDSPSEVKPIRSRNRIYVFDRGSQYDFLQQVEGTYKWVSPVSDEELKKYGLVQRSCEAADINKELVIYSDRSKLKPYEKDFIKCVKRVIDREMLKFSENL